MPDGGNGKLTDIDALEIGRLSARMLTIERDMAAGMASEKECAAYVKSRINELAIEFARQSATICEQLNQIQKDIQKIFEVLS